MVARLVTLVSGDRIRQSINGDKPGTQASSVRALFRLGRRRLLVLHLLLVSQLTSQRGSESGITRHTGG